MEVLYKYHQQYLLNNTDEYKRDLITKIDWDEKLIGIKGAKGVGKTTMILQHIKQTFGRSNQALYVSMDSLHVQSASILDIAEFHQNRGGTHLFIDEIHKYSNWSKDLKSTHDLFSNFNIVFIGSSILQIYAGAADLSRRAVTYHMQGLSFREYLEIETKEKFNTYHLQCIVQNHIEIAHEITTKVKILKYFEDYLKGGYYPFYLKSKKSYFLKLENVINATLEVDMPYVLGVNIQNNYKIKKLLHLLASEVPFQPNITKLSGSLELNKATLNQYLYYLEEAGLLNLLLEAGKGYSVLSKPEKIYLNNSNLAYCLNDENINKGTLRELFVYNQLNESHQINATPYGDFIIDEKYVFEIGGKTKKYKQTANVENSYIIADELLTGVKNKIPIWLFGFLY